MKLRFEVVLFLDGLGNNKESKEAKELVEGLVAEHPDVVDIDVCQSDALALDFKQTSPEEGMRVFLSGFRGVKYGVKALRGLLAASDCIL